MKTKKKRKEISCEALRMFTDCRRIANKAIRKAIEENRKFGISEDDSIYAKEI